MSNKKNHKMRKRSFGTTMGITSIIAILVILVLVVFSTLSLITAKADLTLSEKTSENIEAYYDADGKGEVIISQLSDIINSGANIKKYAKENKYTYASKGGGHLITFTVNIDNSRNLNAQVLFSKDGKTADKQVWQVTPAKEWKEENDVQLFQ